MIAAVFPRQVHVGYRDYAIIRWDSHESKSEGCLGQTDNLLAMIKVDAFLIDRDPVKTANTLLHEILHACWYVGDIEDSDKQEKVVTVIANQLAQLWRDNPAVVTYLDAALGLRS